MGKPGRKSLLTKQRREAIVSAARLGANQMQMARAAGIDRRTLYRWVEQGRQRPKSSFGRLVREIEQAQAEVAAEYLEALRVAATQKLDTRAIKFYLERREGWLPPEKRLKVDARVDAQVEVTDAEYTAEELEQLLAIEQARSARGEG